MSRTAPNARLATAGDKLIRYTAVQVTQAIEMLEERIATAHHGSNSGDTVHSSEVSNPTERAGLTRYALAAELDKLRDAISDCCHTIDLLTKRAEQAQRWITGADKATIDASSLCKSGQQGKDGALDWGDPLCDRLATKAGMCSTHYMRWYRHRCEHSIDTSKDFAA